MSRVQADASAGLLCEEVPLATLATRFGTPLYVYSKRALVDAYAAYAGPLHERMAHGRAMVCYAVKANANLAILQQFARAGAGFDIVSVGELERVLAAGGDPRRVVFSGVGKTSDEMQRALEVGIACFNVESLSEAHRLRAVAGALGVRARVSLRINPDVDAKTHPYIATGLKDTKFGIAYADARAAYRVVAAMPELDVVGVDCHIGSQLLDDGPLLDALGKLLALIDALHGDGVVVTHLDLGGGVGIRYGDEAAEAALDVGAYVGKVLARVDGWEREHGRPLTLVFEPGRSLVGQAGVLLTRVIALKPGEKNFAIVDAAMNDLIRPALYDAWHAVVPVCSEATTSSQCWDLVGPVCESGDWLARDRELALAEGDLLAFLSTGAYGMAMASNYNTRPRAAEVLVDGACVHLVRERESLASLFASERLIAGRAAS